MADGRKSAHFGSRNALTESYEFASDETVTQVHLLSCPNNKYVQGLRLYGTKAKKPIRFIEAIGCDEAGQWQIFDLAKDE